MAVVRDLQPVISLVQCALEIHSPRRRQRRDQLLQFATDLALVGLALRTGYLVDSVNPPDPVSVFTKLVRTLRRQDPIFHDVVYLHDSSGQQAFFVHAPLAIQTADFLEIKKQECLISPQCDQNQPPPNVLPTAFVSLGESTSPALVSQPPPELVEVMQSLRLQLAADTLPESIALPEGLPLSVLVPLAALLLEYPVAYVPASHNSAASLSHTPHDVYECVLATSSHQHTLLKFSCPSALTPSSLADTLTTHFSPRVCKSLPDWTFSVRHNIVELDAVTM